MGSEMCIRDRTLYHGTRRDRMTGIEQHGLVPGGRGITGRPENYFSAKDFADIRPEGPGDIPGYRWTSEVTLAIDVAAARRGGERNSLSPIRTRCFAGRRSDTMLLSEPPKIPTDQIFLTIKGPIKPSKLGATPANRVTKLMQLGATPACLLYTSPSPRDS